MVNYVPLVAVRKSSVNVSLMRRNSVRRSPFSSPWSIRFCHMCGTARDQVSPFGETTHEISQRHVLTTKFTTVTKSVIKMCNTGSGWGRLFTISGYSGH